MKRKKNKLVLLIHIFKCFFKNNVVISHLPKGKKMKLKRKFEMVSKKQKKRKTIIASGFPRPSSSILTEIF